MARKELRFPGEKPKQVRVPKVGLQAVFEERSRSIYGGMKAKYGDKKKDGKVIKVGRDLPFTLHEFRRWLLGQLGGSWDRSIICPYCPIRIHIGDLVIDHRIPTSAPWNGSLALENLVCCCEADNTRKGRMSDTGYKAFIAWATGMNTEAGLISPNLDPRDFNDQLGRMANGSAAVRMRLELMEARKTIGMLKARLAGGGQRYSRPKGLF